MRKYKFFENKIEQKNNSLGGRSPNSALDGSAHVSNRLILLEYLVLPRVRAKWPKC